MKLSNEGNVAYTYHSPSQIVQVVWSPDAKRIASLEYSNSTRIMSIHIWDAFTGQHLVVYPKLQAATLIAWSPNGKDLAVALGKAVEIWDTSTGKVVLTYKGHLDEITVMAWSPNGRYIATGGGSADRTVRVWNSQNGKTVYIYRGYTAAVQSLTWSPDSTRIASFAGGLGVDIWDATTGANQHVYALSYPSLLKVTVAWSPDGTRLAVARGGGIDLWSIATGKIILNYHGYASDEAPMQVLWSPDSQRIASSGGFSDPSLQIWDIATGNFVFRYRTGNLYDDNYYAAWSPNGRYIATSGIEGESNIVQVWDASPGREALVYRGHTGAILSVAWSPDGKYIASDGDFNDKTLQVWVASTGKTLFVYHSTDLLGPIAWSPDSTRIAAGGLENQKSVVFVFDALTGDHQLVYSGQVKVQGIYSQGIYSLSWSHNGKTLASGNNLGNIQVWNAATGKLDDQYTLPSYNPVNSLAWAPNDRYLAAASGPSYSTDPGVVTILSVYTSSTAITLSSAYTYTKHTGPVFTAVWSPDGKYIASGGVDQTVQVWEALTGKLIFTYQGHVTKQVDSAIQQVAWSPNGQRIVSTCFGDSSSSVQVWDATNGGHVYVYTGHLDKVGSVAWAPDSQHIVTGSADNLAPTVQVWLDQR